MQFIVNTEDINYGMGMVTRALAVRPVRDVYMGVLIETPGEGLRLTCTDGEMTIKTTIDGQVGEDGICVLPARLFGELMRRQSGGDVKITVDQNCRAAIKGQGSASTLSGFLPEDYPDVQDIATGSEIVVPANLLRDTISRVMFAVSTDDSRKILTGVLVEAEAEEMHLVGLDGFRMSMQRLAVQNTLPEGKSKISLVMPGRVMNELGHMLPDEDIPVTFRFNSSHVVVTFGRVKLYTSLLTGEYIDYRRILPAECSTRVTIDRRLFGDAIDRCGLMAREGKNNLIYFDITEGKMNLTSAAEKGDVHDELPIALKGAPLRIAFNSKYYADVVRVIDTDEIVLGFNSSVSPSVVLPPEGNQYAFLVLPIRTFN